MSVPSRKNGRFSGKNVSKLDRLRTTWSASTCAKSGFNARSSVRSLVGCHLRSSPALTPGLVPLAAKYEAGSRRLDLSEHEGAHFERRSRREVPETVELSVVGHLAACAA